MMPRLLQFTTMIRYVRFVEKSDPSQTPRYGVIKKFHFIEGSGEQVMVLEDNPFAHSFDAPHASDKNIPLDQVKLLSPVNPGKIIGVGLNYKDHAAEQGKPLPEIPYVFLKSNSSLCGPGDVIRLNKLCTEVHHEAELAIAIGRRCKNVSEAEALDYIAGYAIANDVTDRPIQKKEPTFARAKSMDTFCPLGPFLVHGIDWRNKNIRLWVNGVARQAGNTNDMIHSVPRIVSFVSEFMTLMPEDVILTGTPAGVGPIKSGDKIKIEIDELGILENAVEQV